MTALLPNDVPAYAVPEAKLVPVGDHLGKLEPIPPSRTVYSWWAALP